jgi:outer membrane biosynthesis protein TonB
MKQKSRVLKLPFENHEDRDFILALLGSLIFYACLVLLIHGIKIQERPREDFKRIPPHIAKLILEAPKTTPRPQAQAPGQKAASLPKPQEAPAQDTSTPQASKKETEQKAKAPDKPIAQEPTPLSQEEARLRLEQEAKAMQQRNREVAMQSGLLRLLTKKEDKSPSAVEDIAEAKSLEKVLSPVSGLEQLQQPPPGETRTKGRMPKGDGSGGIDNLIAMLKEQGGGTQGGSGVGSIGERQAARVESPIEIKGAEGEEATRSYESIQEVMDSLRGWIRFVYNRALRENPTLKGTITLEFTIIPSGDVSACRVVSSTVKDPLLEDQLVKRFLQLKFPSIPDGINTVIYPITLVPSG